MQRNLIPTLVTTSLSLGLAMNASGCEGDMNFFRDHDDVRPFVDQVELEVARFYGQIDEKADLSFRNSAENLSYMHKGAVLVDMYETFEGKWRARVRRPVEPIGKQARADYLAKHELGFEYQTFEIDSDRCPEIAGIRSSLEWWKKHLDDPKWRSENAPPSPSCMGCFETIYAIASKRNPVLERSFDDSCGDEYSRWFHESIKKIDECIDRTQTKKPKSSKLESETKIIESDHRSR